MAYKTVVLILQITIILCYQCNCTMHIEGYYWRDYRGLTPSDAVQGGSTADKSLYIGRTIHNGSLIAGKIFDNDPHLYYTYQMEPYETTHQINILCTETPENLVWITITDHNFNLLQNKHAISGGYGPDEGTIYIGRVDYNSEKIVGQIITPISNDDQDTAMVILTGDSPVLSTFTKYEVLTYKQSDVSCM